MPMASPKSPTSLKRTYFDAGLEDAAVENTLIKPEPLRSSHSLNRISRPDALPQGLSTDEAAIDPTLIKSELPPTRNYPTSSTPSASSQNSPADPNAVVQSSVKSIHNSAPTQQMSPVKTERSSKKEKLTFEEKEVRKIEKEFKDRQKAEEKAKKEEEKRARDGVKEKKRKRMEEQNKLKDEEKQRKEEENDKKARVSEISRHHLQCHCSIRIVTTASQRILRPALSTAKWHFGVPKTRKNNSAQEPTKLGDGSQCYGTGTKKQINLSHA